MIKLLNDTCQVLKIANTDDPIIHQFVSLDEQEFVDTGKKESKYLAEKGILK